MGKIIIGGIIEKRWEVFEECGCKVELSGVLQIGNKVLSNDTWISVS